jgi:predicted PurR-regulated permease PerM
MTLASQPGARDSVARRAFTASMVVLAVALLALVAWKALGVLLLMFAGVLVAVTLRFLSDALARTTPLGPGWSLTLVISVLLTTSVAGLWMLGPGVVAEVQELSAGMSQSIADLEALVRQHAVGIYVIENMPSFDPGDAERLWRRIGGIGATVFGAVGAFFITLFIGIFLAYNPRLYMDGTLRLLPIRHRARIEEVLQETLMTLRWWLVGQFISMVLLWLSTWLLLHLLGVPMAFTLGLLTGLLTFIPYLGPLIAIVPIALVAFLVSPAIFVMAVAGYFVIQNIEANVIMPLVFEKTVSIPPALTVASQLLMASVLGFLGVLLATPLLAVVLVLAKRLYVEDVLGDRMDRPLRF